MSRRAVINADDFGFSPAVNQAIITAYREGILTSTSLMVTGAAAESAIELAHQHPNLGVGLHLVLVSGRSVLPPAQIPHLVDATGEFPHSSLQAGLTYQFNRSARGQLELEIRAQLEKFRQTGLSLTHVDGHKHLHCHPVVIDILVSLASEFNIPLIRLPQEELQLNLNWDRRDWLRKTLWWWIFNQLGQYGRSRLQAAGIQSMQRVYGLLQTGRISEDYLLDLIPQIQADAVEIYAHPVAPLRGEPANSQGAVELAALLSHRVRDSLLQAGFELVPFG